MVYMLALFYTAVFEQMKESCLHFTDESIVEI